MRKRRKVMTRCVGCFSSAFLLPVLFIVYYFGLVVVRNGPSPSVCSDMPRSDADGDRPGDHPRKETSDTSPSLRSRIIRTITGWEGGPVQSRWAAQQRPSPDDWIHVFCLCFFVCAARHVNDSLDSLVLMAAPIAMAGR